MTEAEWLDSTEPTSMLAFLETLPGLSEWKVRLFVCACWRARLRVVVEPNALLHDIEAVESGRYRHLPMRFFPTYTNPWEAAKESSKVGIRATGRRRQPEPGLTAAQQAALLRCIFGNPFRPTPCETAWQTPVVLSLAPVGYKERLLPSGELDTARLAVLADALEEAGCGEAAILEHLRGPGPHVLGCHVVDAILGLS